ncbi:amino acid adenylation domain-containing protein [Actinoplanes sp. NPDC048796]|uniref:amino acid adenylation domain-containing protein n=1 Tax=Actinoplanes sp. NPDC048796 TaxID=3155640 RepID=UPI0033D1E590
MLDTPDLTHPSTGAEPDRLDLPFDHLDGRPGAVASVEVVLPAAFSALCRLGRAAGADAPATLLTVLAALVYRHTGQRDLRLGLGEHAVTVRVPAAPTFPLLLRQVATTAPDAAGPAPDVVLRVGAQPVPDGAAPLTFAFGPLGDGTAHGRLHYDAARFDHRTVTALAARLGVLVAGTAADPGRPLDDLPVLTDGDARRMAGLTAPAPPAALATAPLPELIADWAGRRPDAPAVAGARVITYAELNRRAGELAAHLRDRGVRRGDRVGVLSELTADAVVALCGVMAAGAAYVPLDPADPAQRTEELVRDLGCRLTLVPGRDAVPSGAVGERVALTGDDLAYVIHTSGSTGRPKAVGVPHSAVSFYAAVTAAHYGLEPGDRVQQFSSFTFDAFVSELWTTLAAGAALLLRDERVMTPAALLDRVETAGATVIDLPTAYWHLVCSWLAQRGGAVPACLRLVIIGGEAANPTHLRQWLASAGPHVRLLNSYGPTETTCAVTYADLGPAGPPESSSGRSVPIGRPSPGLRTYVLSDRLRPVPPGGVGELFIAGPQLARGYLNAPAATAAAFLPDPWGPPGSRMYRTGDRARLTPDDLLAVLGRRDAQVKVRGFRIELGEVEQALTTFPGVRRAAARVHDHPGSGPVLVGYVAAPGDTRPDEVRAHVRERLSRHSVPDLIVVLPDLPLTSSGKVDGRALPAPETVPAVSPGAFTAAEQAVADIWASVLPAAPSGGDDHFFELGGHSLAVAQVGMRIRAELEVEVSIADLYDRPRLADQAVLVEGLLTEQIAALSDAEVDERLARR